MLYAVLQAQLSSQLSSLGSMLGQPISHMGSYGAPHSIGQDSSSHRMSFESLSQFSPENHSAASSGSRTRGLTEQQVPSLISVSV
jgi:hypothetical protein